MIKKIKLVLGVIMLTVLMGNIGFAAANEAGFAGMMGEFLMQLVKILSWFWIVPAIIAGKLMTNEFVYGSIFHLDKYLWLVWNIMKNFAYFTLGFLFLFVILRSFFKGEPTSVLKDYLPKIVISSFLITATWFFMAALIDLSNIATAAVGSFANNFFEENSTNHTVELPTELRLNGAVDDMSNISSSTEGIQDLKLSGEEGEGLMPKYNDFSGPLLYMGYGIMSLQNYNIVNEESTSLSDVSFDFLIKAVMILMFVIPIILLAVVNILRIFWIWMWVMLSPFIVLDQVFGGPLSQKKHFKIGNMLGLIFQPAAVVGCLSLALILIVSLGSIFSSGDSSSSEGQSNEASCESGGGICIEEIGLKCGEEDSKTCTLSQGKSEELGSMKFKGDIVEKSGDKIGGGLGYIIQSLFVCFLLWGLIKAGFKTTEITSGISDGMFKFVERSAKAAPILPGAGGQSIGSLQRGASNVEGAFSRAIQSDQAQELIDPLENMFGVDSMSKANLLAGARSGGKGGGQTFFKNIQSSLGEEAQNDNPRTIEGSPRLKEALIQWLSIGNNKKLLEDGLDIKIPDEVLDESDPSKFSQWMRGRTNHDPSDARKFNNFVNEAIKDPDEVMFNMSQYREELTGQDFLDKEWTQDKLREKQN